MYIPVVFICVAVSVVSVVNGQILNCNWVNNLDCNRHPPSPMCGSDGLTYVNSCFLAKAQCVDKSLRLAANARCPEKAPITQSIPQTTTPTTPVTSPVTSPVTTTVPVTQISSDPLHTICDTMSHVHCTNDIEPLCGSDDRTYINTCEFHKEVCVHHGLTVKHVGFC